jgi:hypothetical protein
MKTSRLTLALILLAGCGHKNAPEPRPDPAAQAPENPAVMAARRNAPVLDRTMTGNDLDELKKYFDIHRAGTGHWPKNLDEFKQEAGRDAPKLVKLVEDGDIVVNWNAGDQGVIAYGKGAKEQGGMVLTNSGIQRMTADELRQALAGR